MNDTSLISAKQLNLQTCTKQEYIEYFENGWNLYEKVMGSLKDERDYYNPPNQLRRPLIFYLGHTAGFFVNKFILAGAITEEQRVNPHLEQLFAVGVDEMSWDDMNEDHFKWPPMQDVWEFRNQVKKLVLSIVEKVEWDLPITWDKHLLWALVMGCEHERIHIETSSVLIRETDIERVKKPEGWSYAPTHGTAPENGMLLIDPLSIYTSLSESEQSKISPKIRLGKNYLYPNYGWDNEYGNEIISFEKPFEVSKFKVTNGEFLQFINAKGYETREYWDEEGWNWRNYKQTNHPHFWVPIDASKYRFRAMYDIIEMPWDWPVEVNYLEARAYCRWKGSQYSLISEEQFQFIVQTNILLSHQKKTSENGKHEVISLSDLQKLILDTDDRIVPLQVDVANQPNTRDLYNFDFIYGSSTPVDFFPPSQLGVYDLFGNVWEWSDTYFKPRKGFRVHPIYYDFSTPCFDDKHNMILGGSWASTGNESSMFARYAFRRHFFQHSGFRLVKNSSSSNALDDASSHLRSLQSEYFFDSTLKQHEFTSKLYETALKPLLESSHQLITQKLVSTLKDRKNLSSHDLKDLSVCVIGSRTGKLAFELSRFFKLVSAFDFHGFIEICHRMQKNKNSLKLNDETFEFKHLNVDVVANGGSDSNGGSDADYNTDVQFNSVDFRSISDNFEILCDSSYDVLVVVSDIIPEETYFVKLMNQLTPNLRPNSTILVLSSSVNLDPSISHTLEKKFKPLDRDHVTSVLIHSPRNFNVLVQQLTFWS